MRAELLDAFHCSSLAKRLLHKTGPLKNKTTCIKTKFVHWRLRSSPQTPPPTHWDLLALTDFLFMYSVTEGRQVSVCTALH